MTRFIIELGFAGGLVRPGAHWFIGLGQAQERTKFFLRTCNVKHIYVFSS